MSPSFKLLFAIFLPFCFISRRFLCESNPTTLGRWTPSDFCHCQTHRRNHQGLVTNCFGTQDCSSGGWEHSRVLEDHHMETYKSQILIMGWVRTCSLGGPPSKAHIRLESQSVNGYVHVKFLPLATDWASRVITGISMAAVHVHAHENQNSREGILGFPGLLPAALLTTAAFLPWGSAHQPWNKFLPHHLQLIVCWLKLLQDSVSCYQKKKKKSLFKVTGDRFGSRSQNFSEFRMVTWYIYCLLHNTPGRVRDSILESNMLISSQWNIRMFILG